MRKRPFLFVCLIGVLLAIPPVAKAQFTDLPDLGDTASTGLSWQTERQIGQDIMNQIRQKEPTYLDDLEVESYLNTLGGRLAVATPAGTGFHFFCLDDPSINAFAMFGGYVGVNTGLIANVRNESELAGVLAHEISHVTQRHLARGLEKQKQVSMASLLVMALGMLAAHSNSDIASAAITVGMGGAIQAQLGFSREFEREADRAGIELLQKAGFDPHAMSSFFERLQKATRIYENNAPIYLRTHPLTTERISDMQNREQGMPYRQIPDSFTFHLVRARLLARQGTPAEAVARLRQILEEKRYTHEAAAHYGLAVALARQEDWPGVEAALEKARAKDTDSPMIARLFAEALLRKDAAKGMAFYLETMRRFPDSPALVQGYAEALLERGQTDKGLRFIEARMREHGPNARLYRIKARLHALRKQAAEYHHALAEAYALEGILTAAIEQLELAQKTPGVDFYELSAIDARLRQLKREREEERKRLEANGS
jgi:predicted Zn-dependent protease